MDDERASEDADQLAQFLSDVGRLTSYLETSAPAGRSLEDALRIWQRWQVDELRRRYDDVINAHLPRWMYLRNPYRVFVFRRVRRRCLHEVTTPDSKTLEELDMLLGRAQFGAVLASSTRERLRQQIAAGAISSWSVFSVLRSDGCKISKAGFIVPRCVGRLGLSIGSTVGFLMFGILMTAVAVVGHELIQPCVRQCVRIGITEIAFLASYFLALSLWVSWVRRRGVRIFSSLGLIDDRIPI